MYFFDFTTCFKCHDKYRLGRKGGRCTWFGSEFESVFRNKLEKPLKCCNKFIQGDECRSKASLESGFFECEKCFHPSHFSCLTLPGIHANPSAARSCCSSRLTITAHDIDILRNNAQLLNSLECCECDPTLTRLRQQLVTIKEISRISGTPRVIRCPSLSTCAQVFKVIFCHMDEATSASCSSFWNERGAKFDSGESGTTATTSIDLFEIIADFLRYLATSTDMNLPPIDLQSVRAKLANVDRLVDSNSSFGR